MKTLCMTIVIALCAGNASAQQHEQQNDSRFLTWDLVTGIAVTAATGTTAWAKDRQLARMKSELLAYPRGGYYDSLGSR